MVCPNTDFFFSILLLHPTIPHPISPHCTMASDRTPAFICGEMATMVDTMGFKSNARKGRIPFLFERRNVEIADDAATTNIATGPSAVRLLLL